MLACNAWREREPPKAGACPLGLPLGAHALVDDVFLGGGWKTENGAERQEKPEQSTRV